MPAVRAAAAVSHQGTLVQVATLENIKQNVQRLQAATPILSKAHQAGKVKIVGGLYYLDTGKVELVSRTQ